MLAIHSMHLVTPVYLPSSKRCDTLVNRTPVFTELPQECLLLDQ